MNIDRTKPKIELIEIQNTNTNYPKYANKTHTISFKIKITEKNIGQNNIVKDFFEFKLDGKNIDIVNGNLCIKEIESTNEGKIYHVCQPDVPRRSHRVDGRAEHCAQPGDRQHKDKQRIAERKSILSAYLLYQGKKHRKQQQQRRNRC